MRQRYYFAMQFARFREGRAALPAQAAYDVQQATEQAVETATVVQQLATKKAQVNIDLAAATPDAITDMDQQ